MDFPAQDILYEWNNISMYGYTTIGFSICHLMDIWIVAIF